MSKLGDDLNQLYISSDANLRKAINYRNKNFSAYKRGGKLSNIYYVKYLHFYQEVLMYRWARYFSEVCYYQQTVIDKMSLKVQIDDKAIKELQDNLRKSIKKLKELAEPVEEPSEEQYKPKE